MTRLFALILFVLAATQLANCQCACCAGASTGSSSMGYNGGELTLNKKHLLLEGYGDYRSIRVQETHHHHDTTEEETPLKSMVINSLGIRYGITDKIMVSALLPYAFLHTDKGNDRGIGDLILLGTASILNRNDFRLALQAGIELPTGVQKGSRFDNTTVVVGSGSFDPIIGALFSKKWGKLALQGNGLYKHTTKGFDKNNYGSVAVQSLFASYRLKGENKACATDSTEIVKEPGFGCTLFGGYYGEWLSKIKEGGLLDDDSGYYLGFAMLGTNLSYRKWSLPITFSLPFVQHMNGQQNDAGIRAKLGIIKSF